MTFKSMALAVFYLPLLPIATFLSAIEILVNFWVYKYRLIKKSRISDIVSPEFTFSMI